MTVKTTEHASHYNDFTGLANLRAQAKKDQKSALNETASQFEALFIQMMLSQMRKSIPKEGMFDSQAVQTYQDMADKQVSLDMAKRSDFGIADMIKAQLEQQGMAVPAEQILKSRQESQAFQIQPLRLDRPLGRGFNAGIKLPDSSPSSFDIKRQDAAAMLLKQN